MIFQLLLAEATPFDASEALATNSPEAAPLTVGRLAGWGAGHPL